MYDPSRKFQNVSPPRAGSGVGSLAVLATSAVAAALSLASVGTQTANVSSAATSQGLNGAVGQYITIKAVTTDCGIVFGPTVASVTGGNVPVLATVGTLTGNNYTVVTGVCYRVLAGQEVRYLLQPGVDLFLGFVSTGAGQIEIFQSNPTNA